MPATRSPRPVTAKRRATHGSAKPTPKLKPESKPALPSKKNPLRFWVSGVPIGINHAQEMGQPGQRRHLTPEAQSWGMAVWAKAFGLAQIRDLRGPERWQAPVDGTAGVLAVALHFFVGMTRSKSSSRVKRLDVDAPVKLTLDKLCEGLGLDDKAVRLLSVSHTLIEDNERTGGYGKTRQGVWITVWRMSAAEVRALNAVVPGAAS